MTERTISITQDFPQPLDAIFSFLSKHENLGVVFGIPVRRVVDAPDKDNPDGLGSVRRLKIGPVSIEETIVTFEKNRLIEYRVTKGGGLKHHLGVMRFSGQKGGSTLDYTIEIESKLPFATFPVKFGLEAGIRRGLHKLASRGSL
jgi:hypothetical protein